MIKKTIKKIKNNKKNWSFFFFSYLQKNAFWFAFLLSFFEITPLLFLSKNFDLKKSLLLEILFSFEIIFIFLISILAITSTIIFFMSLYKIKKNCDKKKLQNPCWIWWTNNKPKKSWILYLKIMNWSAFVSHLVLALLNMAIAIIYFKNEFVFVFICLILPIICTIINFYLFYIFILKIDFSKMI